MAVQISIINKTIDDSRECLAALELKDIIKKSIPQNVNGHIYIGYSLTMCGQAVRDLDLMVIGRLDNYVLTNYYSNLPTIPKKNLIVKDFCYAIELKEQSADFVKISNTHVYVEYKNQLKDATEQSEKQRYALMNYLSSICNCNLFITNLVWLKSLSKNELDKKKNRLPIGALPNHFSFNDLIDMSFIQGYSPWYEKNEKCYYFYADKNASIDYLSIIKQNLFSDRKLPSEFTRKKLEILMQNKVSSIINNAKIGEELTVFSGKAGTGKTFILIQTALFLANENNGNRCLLLTYNHALVSDIRRLLHYIEVPDGIDSYTVQISTLHKFFMQLMKIMGISTKKIIGNQFDTEYKKGLKELSTYITDLMNEKDIKVLKEDNELAIDWDYIFIDEGQDWLSIEKEILIKIYGKERLIIADGGQQFIRANEKLVWSRKSTKLSYGRRQKNLIVAFVNSVAAEMGLNWSINADKDFVGGKVVIRKNYDRNYHQRLEQYCKEQHCENYDILFLVPPTMVDNGHYKNLDTWRKVGIQVFDGTNAYNREKYTIKVDECRLFQYESCRGLEGWVTVCLQFDQIFEEKMKDYQEIGNDDALVLESFEERRWKYVCMWLLMPLTRAIDRLVITLKEPNSEIGKILKKVAEKQPDFVDWEIED